MFKKLIKNIFYNRILYIIYFLSFLAIFSCKKPSSCDILKGKICSVTGKDTVVCQKAEKLIKDLDLRLCRFAVETFEQGHRRCW